MWECEGEARSEDESARVSRENNVCNGALHVIGLYGPGDKGLSLLGGSGACEVALSCHIAMDLLCQEMHEAWMLC